MYPEAVDGLPDTQQPQPDGQLLPLQPRKIPRSTTRGCAQDKMSLLSAGGAAPPGRGRGGGQGGGGSQAAVRKAPWSAWQMAGYNF